MTQSLEWAPGQPAPTGGIYGQLNIFGGATGIKVQVSKGQPLPPAPRGCSWVLVANETGHC